MSELCHDYNKRGICTAIDSAYKSPLIPYSFVRSNAQIFMEQFYVLLRVRIAPANAPTKISGEILTNIHSNA